MLSMLEQLPALDEPCSGRLQAGEVLPLFRLPAEVHQAVPMGRSMDNEAGGVQISRKIDSSLHESPHADQARFSRVVRPDQHRDRRKGNVLLLAEALEVLERDRLEHSFTTYPRSASPSTWSTHTFEPAIVAHILTAWREATGPRGAS
jgi:hypothetical protein